jgi:N-acetyltransferase 10
MRKKLDARIPALVTHGVESRHRTLFVIVGDRGKDQVVNLHYLLSKASTKRPSVLWAYKKDLGFSSHREKRARQLKARIARGLHDADTDDPFELFVSSTEITYVYYKTDTHRVLGRTYGMAVLQDFEAVTPNILARTIETVEGGGIVCILLKTMESLTRLYSLAMDVHARFRSDAHGDVVPRFNERFTLSIADCANAIVVDDELSVLPISSSSRTLAATLREARRARGAEARGAPREPAELTDLKESLADTPVVGSIVPLARTIDQARALLTLIESISEKTLRTTVSLTAARGRGKSVALGLAIAHAVASGYSNIFVTAPTPENLGSVFDFLVQGLDAAGYEEHVDFEVIRSTVPELRNAIIRVNVMRSHRQTVQYIRPQDASLLAACELLVIDEAAAIPLREVRALLGPYLVFLSSTINGYEGTGRSLSLKLLAELRRNQTTNAAAQQQQQQQQQQGASGADTTADAAGLGVGRILREIVLRDPIRYAPGDKVEAWLNSLLCLNAGDYVPPLQRGAPHPDQCDLYRINRDTLFSHHAASETFLQRVQGVLCASHYRNTPNDLLMLADAPGHCLFVLLGPIDEHDSSSVPDVLCVLQVALEGRVSRERVLASVSKGQRPSGDLIPWAVATQFGESSFAALSGARVVRIATHPGHQAQGYGSQALKLLMRYYRGEMPSLDSAAGGKFGDNGGDSDSDGGNDDSGSDSDSDGGGKKSKKQSKKSKSKSSKSSSKDEDLDLTVGLHGETIKPRRNLPPLLARLGEHAPENLDWIGVSYGLTLPLCKFWSRLGFRPVYLRLEPNDITGEHSCVMIRSLEDAANTGGGGGSASGPRDWAVDFSVDFSTRLASLLGHDTLRTMPVRLALTLVDSGTQGKGMSATGSTAASSGGANLVGYVSEFFFFFFFFFFLSPL